MSDDWNIRPCSICGTLASFERNKEDPPEGEVCIECHEWVCDDCVDWTYMKKIQGEDPICKKCGEKNG